MSGPDKGITYTLYNNNKYTNNNNLYFIFEVKICETQKLCLYIFQMKMYM